jgi:hypothetical protein
MVILLSLNFPYEQSEMPFDVLPRRQDFYGSQLFGSSFIFEPPPLCCSAVAAAAARIDGSTGSDSNPTMPLRCTPRFPNCNLYNRDGLQASPPGLLMTTLKRLPAIADSLLPVQDQYN